MSKALVYRGEGAGWRSIKSTCESVERLLAAAPLSRHVQPLQVDTLSTADLLQASWQQHAALLVMPGGADLPYCSALNGRGNRIIKEFVESGGSYLGLCAGAYYACSRVVFEPGTPLEVIGDRELAFFPGIARGAAFPGFDYATEAGAVAAQLEFLVPEALQQHQQQQQQKQANPTQPHAAVLQPGAAAAPLASPSPRSTLDYCNGGPYFTAADGSPDIEQLPGITALAMYCQVPLTATPGVMQEQQQQQQHSQQALVRRAAAVRCRVGKGVAVLCGTHPELGPQWLDPCGESNAENGPQALRQQAAALDAAVASTAAPSQQPSHQAVVSAQIDTLLLTKAVATSTTAANSSSEFDVSTPDQAMPVVCKNIALAKHAQQLQRDLQASQEGRDLLLSSLLYEALVRPPT